MSLRSMKLTSAAVALGLAIAVPASTPAWAQAESQDKIIFALNDWTGQLITTKIMGGVLQKAGYNVDYVVADYLAQFAGLETGDLTVSMEVWATTGQEASDKAIATGKVEHLGEIGTQAKEEWWYPAYMKEKCPGLPDWKALKEPACIEAFSIPETAPKGRYLGGPVTWGGFDEERVAALGLDFEVIHAGTDAALFAELESAYQRQAPIMLWIYSPHWAPAKFEGEWVEFPVYEPACYTDPAWGDNKDATHDCGKPFGAIWKVASSSMKDKWPIAYKAVKAYAMTNEEMNALNVKADVDGMSVDDVAAEWIANNEDRWKAWLK